MSKTVTLEEFFAVWCTLQNFTIKEFHLEVLQFLADDDCWDNKTAVLQVFRNAGKSTMLAVYIVWKLVQNPELRILIRSADNETAKKVVADVRDIITRHPLANHLMPDTNETWNENEIFVKGHRFKRDPSVAARGILTNVTGGRADINVFDDVEVPKNCSTMQNRSNLRARIRETSNLLEPTIEGITLFVGTPHTVESIYPEEIQKACSNLTLPLFIDSEGEYPFMTGTSRWPEKFGEDEIYLLQRKNTKGEFSSQYLLLPYNILDSRLNPEFVQWYREEITYREANRKAILTLNGEKLVHVTAFWDVALSTASGDASVLAVVYVGERGTIYIHRLHELKGVDPEHQCIQVKNHVLREYVPSVIVETNGIGNFIPAILRNHLSPLGINVIGSATTTNKATRIIKSFETPLYGRFLMVHESAKATPFLAQLRDFNPAVDSEHDDFIDAPASAIEREPVRIGRVMDRDNILNRHRNWGNQNQTGQYGEYRMKL